MMEKRSTVFAGAEELPLWRRTSTRSAAWSRILSTSPYLTRQIKYGIRDMPSVPFTEGIVLPIIPQTEEDKEFARMDISEGISGRIYEELSKDYVEERVKKGLMVSSAFVVWQGEEKKGRFVINFHRQSKHWAKGSIKMETIPSFALEMERDDFMFSFDIKAGYRHFYLHPSMRDYFMFRYENRYFRCIALPFGWGRSPLWFTKFMRPLVEHMRATLGYRVLPYIDDFLVAPSRPGRASTERDARRARTRLSSLLDHLGLVRKVGKGCWEGSRQIEHLGMYLDSSKMRVFVADSKVRRVRQLAQAMLLRAQRNRRLVPVNDIRRFCGVCISLTLAFPLSRFYTRSLFFDMSARGSRDARFARWRLAPGEVRARGSRGQEGNYVRLSHQSLRDLRFWRCLTRGEGRELQPASASLTMHADAANVGYGGTLGYDAHPGSRGLWEAQGFWSAEERQQSITLRELRAVRLLLQKSFASYVSDPKVKKILLHEDNSAVVHILNSMVSASPSMMSELRKLRMLLQGLGVRLEAKWIPSAVNRFADALSRTWDPGDIHASRHLTDSIARQFHLDPQSFMVQPLNETRPSRLKQIQDQLREPWSDNRCRLWNPTFDFLPIVVKKIEQEKASGILIAPIWPAQPWFARLRGLPAQFHPLDWPTSTALRGTGINPAWRLVAVEIRFDKPGWPAYDRPF